METDINRRGPTDNNTTWFMEELAEYSTGIPGGREDSRLLIACDRFRSGEASGSEYQRYKSAAIDYITTRLPAAPLSEQEACFQFLLQSELINESVEIRNALHMLLQSRLTVPLDKLSLNIVTALLRSRRPPSDNLMQIICGKVRKEYLAAPSWNYIGALAALVGRTGELPYTNDNLIQDIARLADSPDFDRALHLRNTIWTALNPPLDSISILTRIRRGQSMHRHNYPPTAAPTTPDFSQAMDYLQKSIVKS